MRPTWKQMQSVVFGGHFLLIFFGKIWANILRTPKNVPAPTPMGWEIDERNLQVMNESYFVLKWDKMRKTKATTQSISDLSTKRQTSEIYLRTSYVMSCKNIGEVATLVSTIPNFWCSLEVAAAELHLCFVIKCNLWWKHTFLPMVAVVVLHYKHIKHMKLFTPFTPHVIAWSVRKGFNQLICRTKEQKTRLQSLTNTMPKSEMPSGAKKR